MYVPKINSFTEQKELLNFIKKFSFGIIVSIENNLPIATHLPFILSKDKEGNDILYTHFAKVNPQWKTIENQKILVIFTEPHAYISPITL